MLGIIPQITSFYDIDAFSIIMLLIRVLPQVALRTFCPQPPISEGKSQESHCGKSTKHLTEGFPFGTDLWVR